MMSTRPTKTHFEQLDLNPECEQTPRAETVLMPFASKNRPVQQPNHVLGTVPHFKALPPSRQENVAPNLSHLSEAHLGKREAFAVSLRKQKKV